MSSQFQSGRTAKGFALILGAARAAGLRERPAGGNVLVQKAGSDELVILAMNDPVMAAAIHEARKTLRKFLTLARNPGPTMIGFSAKIAIPGANGFIRSRMSTNGSSGKSTARRARW
jgi:hypothetical protein